MGAVPLGRIDGRILFSFGGGGDGWRRRWASRDEGGGGARLKGRNPRWGGGGSWDRLFMGLFGLLGTM